MIAIPENRTGLTGRQVSAAILSINVLYLLMTILGKAGYSSYLSLAVAPGLMAALLFPGFLMTRLLGITWKRLSETLVVSVGASIFLLFASGLIINTVLPVFGVEGPLGAPYMIILVVGMNTMALLWCRRRNVDLALAIRLSQPTAWVRLLYVIPPLFVLVSMLGAVSLNGGGTNYLTMSMIAGIAAYSLFLLLLKERLPASLFTYSLYFICLAVLLTMSLRSWLISGHDVLQEYSVFRLTDDHLRWRMSYFQDAYNACLSITILPTMISSLVPKIPEQYIFRFIFQAVFALTPVALFCFIERYLTKTYAFIAALFFISQAPLLRDFAFLTRQEMATFFYLLILLVLIRTSLANYQRYVLATIFSISMIWSHYSTTYIALAVFILVLVVKSDTFRRISSRIGFARAKNGEGWLPGWRFVLLLAVLTLAWNSWITGTSDNLRAFSDSVIQTVTGANRFWDYQAGAAEQFNIFSKAQEQSEMIETYASTSIGGGNTARGLPYLPYTYADYDPQIDSPVLLEPKVPGALEQVIYYLGEIIKKLTKAFILIGALWAISARFGGAVIDQDFKALIKANIGILVLTVFIPLLSIDYGLMRAYQQMLIVLCLPAVIGALVSFTPFVKRFAFQATAAFFVLYFLFLSSFVPQLIGSGYAQMQLNNYGLYYDIYYTHQSEVDSIEWLAAHGDEEKPVFSDWFARKKIMAFSPRQIWAIDNVLPENITQDSYVYVDYTNKNKQAAYVFYKGREVNYQFPSSFLERQKDTIYSNGDTEIMR